ncbi:ABC transporter substrate-binding protein [Ornithinimicrobium sufpigmenti]|uniref:ABC transporter substrate-binding protein n=1 Tax=Ornithinimicrobium sufpigmenti TaxID=2508882 RepID=UPI001036D280|nr:MULTISPECIES: ABC transporter substrate-binding protein [unclassified Ornithinimicrobium]
MLRYGATLPISSLDGVRSSANEATSLLYSRLVTVDAFGEIALDLAGSHDVSPDGLQHTFRPRGDATWSDDRPVTAEDLTLALRLVSDPGLRARSAFRLVHVRSVESVGDATVVTLTRPMPSFLHALNKVRVVPAHRHTAEEYAEGACDADPVGSGPYRLVERTEGGCTFEARQDYFGTVPGIGTIRMQQIAQDRDRALALAQDEIDFGQIKAQDVDVLTEDVRAHSIRTRVWRALSFRLSHPLLADARVRRALSELVDREEVVLRALGGYGLPQYWPTPPSSWASPQDVPPTGVEQAAETLTEAGWERSAGGWWKDGQQLVLRLAYLESETFRRVTSEVIAEQFGRFGIPVQLTPITWEAYRDMDAHGLRDTEHDGMVVGWSGGVDPYENLASRYRSDGVYNRDGYRNPRLDDVLDRAVQAPERAEARDLYHQVMRMTHEDSIMAPLANPMYLFGARSHLTGFEDFEVDSFYELPQYANLIRSTT